MLVSVETLRELVSYDAATGALRWLVRSPAHFKRNRDCAGWNTKYAGTLAFTTDGPTGYKTGHIFQKTYMAHRVAWALHTGRWPTLDIDHIDGNRQNNRAENLRVVSAADNQRNVKHRADNTSGVKGVDFRKPSAKWRARIVHEGARLTLGLFDNFEEAVAARRDAEKRFGYHPNHGRIG
jgi:hypothetical protein